MKHISARGETINIEQFLQHDTVAVGNGQMNARGDKIDRRGKVIETREQREEAAKKLVTKSTPIAVSIIDSVMDIDDIAEEFRQSRKNKTTPNPDNIKKKTLVNDDESSL